MGARHKAHGARKSEKPICGVPMANLNAILRSIVKG
jgi:hypothetical protein